MMKPVWVHFISTSSRKKDENDAVKIEGGYGE